MHLPVAARRDARLLRARVDARRRRGGFTLLEVINALVIICAVGALAMYFVARYVRHAKTAEAAGSVKAIAEAAAAYYDTSDSAQPAGSSPDQAHAMRHFPPSSRAAVPPDLADIRGRRYQSTLADWSVSPWTDLHFSIPQPQFYSYTFEAQGRGGTAQATVTGHGDLDGDGVVSTYSLTVAPDEKLHAVVSKTMEKQNVEE